MTLQQRQFHLEEFKTLHSQVAGALKYHHDMMRFALAASAAVFAWLATHRTEGAIGISAAIERGWYLPAGIVLFSIIGGAALYWRVHQINTYIRNLENSLGAEDLGWQSWLRRRSPILGSAALLFWIALFAVDCLVPFLIF